jgi:hypothetical protein
MPLPKAIKIKKNGVEYVSKVDQAQYLITELIRAALRDAGNLIRRRAMEHIRALPGMKSFKNKRPPNAFQYWNRKREGDLVVGIKHDTWYGVDQELGTRNQPKRSVLRDTVFNNIDEIRRIQGQYLSTIADENKALGLIDEEVEFEDGQND